MFIYASFSPHTSPDTMCLQCGSQKAWQQHQNMPQNGLPRARATGLGIVVANAFRNHFTGPISGPPGAVFKAFLGRVVCGHRPKRAHKSVTISSPVPDEAITVQLRCSGRWPDASCARDVHRNDDVAPRVGVPCSCSSACERAFSCSLIQLKFPHFPSTLPPPPNGKLLD